MSRWSLTALPSSRNDDDDQGRNVPSLTLDGQRNSLRDRVLHLFSGTEAFLDGIDRGNLMGNGGETRLSVPVSDPTAALIKWNGMTNFSESAPRSGQFVAGEKGGTRFNNRHRIWEP